ncbi:MAG: hypothetical protein HRU20_27275 [Pseudomonadales bacterium]|nr:hypothetical protein [Pseudomonadales bacterium]
MSWQESLGDLFSATVNQQSLEEAAEMMVSVSEDDLEYHNACVNTLNLAIQSCKNGNNETLLLINKSGYQVHSTEKALEILEDFLTIYLNEYKDATE